MPSSNEGPSSRCSTRRFSAEPNDEPPLEATPADWQEQLETVELDPELDELDR